MIMAIRISNYSKKIDKVITKIKNPKKLKTSLLVVSVLGLQSTCVKKRPVSILDEMMSQLHFLFLLQLFFH